jgi:hypothetical protein
MTLDSNGVSIDQNGKKLVVSDSEINVDDGAFEVT